jgi:hypothetical protein
LLPVFLRQPWRFSIPFSQMFSILRIKSISAACQGWCVCGQGDRRKRLFTNLLTLLSPLIAP